MAGYLLIENKFLKNEKENGIEPNLLRMGFLDYLRELREEPFHFPRGHKILIEGVEDVLIAAGENRDAVASYIHDLLVSRANELERMGGYVQIVFKRKLIRADDFWFEHGMERISLTHLFGPHVKEDERWGNRYFTVGFNLT